MLSFLAIASHKRLRGANNVATRQSCPTGIDAGFCERVGLRTDKQWEKAASIALLNNAVPSLSIAR